MSPSGARRPDPRPALREAAERLSRAYEGVFGRETVERFLGETYAELASRSTVPSLLPRQTEAFARQRLQALARVEGRDPLPGRPVVLFLCVHNAGRSQMALGLFTRLAGSRAQGWSAGSEPVGGVHPVAVDAMRRRGIDISGEFPKPWTDEVVRAADVVVTMGCGDACPVYPGKRYVDWPLPDPDGQDLDAVCRIRDEIERRVRGLLVELGVSEEPEGGGGAVMTRPEPET
ncbi:arsenate reductase ArsC [Streptomyces sp. NPDC051940]|uniref:arsenate reductase ArsC n=1 Tax=Streptomyces sp. NPDC051940 TaxID=3155675 RepID=UPI00342E80A6